jgi:predicted permease
MSWRRFLRRAEWDAERARELESYLRIETDDNIARGMTPEAAHAAAARKLGNVTRVREDIYRQNTLGLLETLARDLRYGFRVLRRHPTFTIVASLTLAIGIGANTAVFGVVNSVMLKPLPYPDADQLVAVWNKAPGAPGIADVSGDLRLSLSMYVTYDEQNRSFSHFGVWVTGAGAVTGFERPEEVRVIAVSDGVLQALGIQPAHGRWLSAADQQPAASRTVMLTYGYWQRHFASSGAAIGQQLTLDGQPSTIVGVMPRGFKVLDADADMIVPLQAPRANLVRPGFGFFSVARLKPGVTVAQANTDLARMLPIWLDSWPGGTKEGYLRWKITPAIRPLKQDVLGNAGNFLWVLMGTIGIVLLIAAANVANLVLVRADERRQEIAVRAALGAGSWRIAREALIESVVLAMLSGVIGLGLSHLALRALVAMRPTGLPRLDEIGIDARTFWFMLALSLVAGVLVAAAPILSYPRLIARTIGGSRGTIGHTRANHRAQHVMVVAQVALALVLLVAAGLMARTFRALHTVPIGISDPQHQQTVRLAIPPTLVAEPQRVVRLHKDIADAIRAIPGVTSVGFANTVAMEGRQSMWDSISVEGRDPVANGMRPLRRFKYVSAEFFAASGTRIVAGREFSWTDILETRPTVIVSENLAREEWGTPAAALGQRLRWLPMEPWREVIGVVEDVRDNGVQEPSPAIVYWPPDPNPTMGQLALRNMTYVVRSPAAGTLKLVQQIEQAVRSVNGSLPAGSVRTMEELYERSLSRTAFTLVMILIAGTMALLLGLIGVYGLISYTVSQRRREIGIRLALGAAHAEVRRTFVRQGLILTTIGVVLGVAAAAGATRALSSLLFAISPLDPLTYAVVAALLLLAASAASYLPARRASRVPPMEALAAE